MKRIIALVSVIFICTSSQSQNYHVEVHPGTELLHIINYYGGVYKPAVAKSAYLRDVQQYFDQYKNHQAVKFASHLKFNDFVDLGWCIEFPDVQTTEPRSFGFLEKFHSYDTLITYLRLSAQFAKESNFYQFYQQNKEKYGSWTEQFKQSLNRSQPLQKLQDFYKDTINKIPYFSLSPLGVVLRANVQSEIINPKYGKYAPIIIPYDFRYVDNKKVSDNEQPSFDFNHTIGNNIWHEVSHVYWEELSRPYRKEILALEYQDTLSRKFQPFSDQQLNFYFFFHEVMADAIAIFLKKVYDGPSVAEAHLKINEQAGSPLYRKMVGLFEQEYWPKRNVRHFQAFMPSILKMMKEVPKKPVTPAWQKNH
jgi:hypothetical protein